MGFFADGPATRWAAAGPWTRGDLEALIPYDVPLAVLDLSAAHFHEFVEIAFNGARPTPWISGFSVVVLPEAQDSPVKDLNQDHKIEHWEVSRLAKLLPLDPTKTNYRLAVPLPIALGAEDLQDWVRSRAAVLPPLEKMTAVGMSMRQAVFRHLKRQTSDALIPTLRHTRGNWIKISTEKRAVKRRRRPRRR